MPADIYLKLEGIKGEADGKYKDQIAILSWELDIKNNGSAHFGSGMGAGKMQAGDLILSKRIDIATPALMRACATGKHIASATLTALKADGNDRLEYFKIELKDILVSSVGTRSVDTSKEEISNDEKASSALEGISLNFAEFKVIYTKQDGTGAAGAQAEFGYNIAQNKTV